MLLNMQITSKNEKLHTQTVIALGIFDGLHKGHKSVISKAIDISKQQGYEPVVVSFSPQDSPPKQRLSGSIITTDSVKWSMLDNIGVKRLILLDFSEIKHLKPEEFLQSILIDKFNVKHIVCGQNYRFGENAKGDTTLLKFLCKAKGIQLTVVEPILDLGLPISSTRVRESLAAGDITTANRLLGYNYCFDFLVICGDKIGRTIGTPTINQKFPTNFAIPKFGSYASYVEINGNKYKSITNIGVKPTVNNLAQSPLAETHIIGYEGDLYSQNIKVSLLEYIRKESKFASLDELKSAIKKDIQYLESIYAKNFCD